MKSSAKKILILGPSWVGDMVMAQALFKQLKFNHPDNIIDVLAPTWSLPILDRMPEVNQVLPLDIKHGELALLKRYRIGKSLRDQGYDQFIVLTNSFKSALIPYFSGIPQRTSWLGEYRYGLINDIYELDPKKYPLMVERFVMLGLPKDAPLPKPLPYPKLIIDHQQREKTLKKFNLNQAKPIVALCPGAEFGSAKRWPETHFAEVANTKLDAGFQVWIFGSPKDLPVATTIMNATRDRAVNLAGKTTLSECVDLLALASCVISNDSGLMHLSAALDRPVIALYGSTSPDFAPPLATHAKSLYLNLECSPCRQRECPLGHHRCLEDIKAETVLRAMESVADERGAL